MALGDSITEGSDQGVTGGYRGYLHSLLSLANAGNFRVSLRAEQTELILLSLGVSPEQSFTFNKLKLNLVSS